MICPPVVSPEKPVLGEDFPQDVLMDEECSPVMVVMMRLCERAVRTFQMTDEELQVLETGMEELGLEPPLAQAMAVEKFFGLPERQLCSVVSKLDWLKRCREFCVRELESSPASPHNSAKSIALTLALARSALYPDAIPQEAWNRFQGLPDSLQGQVLLAVQQTVLANISKTNLPDFFDYLISNEIKIEDRLSRPITLTNEPEQLSFDSIDDKVYKIILQQFLIKGRLAEEQVLYTLEHIMHEQALLRAHRATSEARAAGSAQFLSLLHSAASLGLPRLCARFIADGLDVNEQTGVEAQAPLHLASVKGEAQVVDLLLRHRADPNVRDAEGRTPLYLSVASAVQTADDPRITPSQQRRVCHLLLLAGASSSEGGEAGSPLLSPEQLAKQHKLTELHKLMHLHARIRSPPFKDLMTERLTEDLYSLQHETAWFVLKVFASCVRLPSEAATSLELEAITTSDFIKFRDEIQHMGNRLGRRLQLPRKAVDRLVDLPAEAARYALSTWTVEEVISNEFEVHETIQENSAPQMSSELQRPSADEPDAGTGGGIAQGECDHGDQGPSEGSTSAPAVGQMYYGKVRKWDPERAFGFILQDPEDGSEICKDIFVHRKNVLGSERGYHIDLREGHRICFRLGVQDGKPRAMDAAMVDSSGKILDLHTGQKGNGKPGTEDSADDFDPEDRITRSFIQHLQKADVKDMVAETKSRTEAWLRCMGFKRSGKQSRDSILFNKEIEHRIDLFLASTKTPVRRSDFDFSLRKLLQKCGSLPEVSAALAKVEMFTVQKTRGEVTKWPAYLAALLRPKYDTLADRRLRAEERQSRNQDLEDAGQASSSSDGEGMCPRPPSSSASSERGITEGPALPGTGPNLAELGQLFTFQ